MNKKIGEIIIFLLFFVNNTIEKYFFKLYKKSFSLYITIECKKNKKENDDEMEIYEKSRQNGVWKKIIISSAIAILIMIIISLYNMYNTISSNTYENNNNIEVQRLTITTEIEPKVYRKTTDILEDATKFVVGISRVKEAGSAVFLNDGVNKLGLGSGIIVSEDGYILTNEHVSGEKYGKCYVTLENGETKNADVVWSDKNLDLSIIKIEVKGLKCAELGNSNNVQIGETVYAIGNPIGFEFQKTVTSGIISGINRTLKFDENEDIVYMSDLIQTDATINPGNSGGPLINSEGNVIGINSIKITSAEGIGFAIPINIVKPIIEKFKQDGKFEEAEIGIFAYDKNVIPYLNNGVKFDTGIYIANISKDSQCQKAGLKEGDIITKIDGKELNKMSDLREYIYNKSPGEEVNLTILRNRKQNEIKIKLAKK